MKGRPTPTRRESETKNIRETKPWWYGYGKAPKLPPKGRGYQRRAIPKHIQQRLMEQAQAKRERRRQRNINNAFREGRAWDRSTPSRRT